MSSQALRRRVTYLMLFRLVLISLVLGATIVISTLGDYDMASPYSLVLFAIIGGTYLLTVIYAVALQRGVDAGRLADVQMVLDLVVTALLVHVTGGARSAYTFFFPLAIIGAATIRYRAGAVIVALASVALFVAVSLLGWAGVLPVPHGQRILPSDIGHLELVRAMALNGAAIASVAVLAYSLGAQIQRTARSLEVEREAAANMYQLHDDIVRSLSSGLITVGGRGNVVAVNQAAADILGRPAGTLIGVPIAAALPGIEALLAGVGPRDAVRRADLTMGRRYFGISVTPLRDNHDQVIGRIVNFQDLTELRQMEAQVRRAERMAAIGTLAAGVAHEIRNPLASISGSVELLRGAGGDDADALMAIITREIERLNRMLKDLLDYANPQPRERVPFDLASLVDETLRVFVADKTFDGVDVALVAGSLTEGLALEGDPARLRQVIWNLLRNAAEAAGGGGKHVTVRVGRDDGMATVQVADPDRPGVIEIAGDAAKLRQVLWNLLRNAADAAALGGRHVHVDAWRDIDATTIAVTDDGPGIAADQLARIFDPFFTTKNKGTGLGLATCHAIIAEHGG
ncbi:MAG TPA: ATP-binding protein, partial [Kofleriaceae bacterium]|nr:ATP-binding protein [Kofleriaceae bacterium]